MVHERKYGDGSYSFIPGQVVRYQEFMRFSRPIDNTYIIYASDNNIPDHYFLEGKDPNDRRMELGHMLREVKLIATETPTSQSSPDRH